MKNLKYIAAIIFLLVFADMFSQRNDYELVVYARDYWHLNPGRPRPGFGRVRVFVDFTDGSSEVLLDVNRNPFFTQNLGPEYQGIASYVFDRSRRRLKRIRIYQNVPGGGTRQVTQNSPTVCGGWLGDMMGGVTFSVKAKPKINITRVGSQDNIAGYASPIEISTTPGYPNDHYSNWWQYQIGIDGVWTSVPDNVRLNSPPNVLKVIPRDFLPEDVVNEPTRSINFRARSCDGIGATNVLNYEIRNSAPNIIGTNQTPVSCFGGKDGAVTLTFDRSLVPGEQLNISVIDLSTPLKDNNGDLILEGGKQVYLPIRTFENLTFNSNEFNGGNTINIDGLPSSEDEGFGIGLIVGLDGNTYYTDGQLHSSEFKIGRPEAPVSFTVDDDDTKNISCKYGSDGEIHLSALGGGVGTYQYNIVPAITEGDNEWLDFTGEEIMSEPEVEMVDLFNEGVLLPITVPAKLIGQKHKIAGLKADIDYNIKVRKKLNSGTNCIAKEKTIIDGKTVLGEVKIVTRKLTEPLEELQLVGSAYKEQPKAKGFTNGLIKVSVKGGTRLEGDDKYTFQWKDKDGNLINSSTGVVNSDDGTYTIGLNDIGKGIYYLTVTDKNDCKIEDEEFTLGEPDAITLGISQTGTIECYGDETVTLTANASGGIQLGTFDNNGLPYYYKWKKKNDTDIWEVLPETSDKLEDIGAGDYAVNVIDANGITIGTATNNVIEPGDEKDAVVTLKQPDELRVEFSSKTDVYCFNGNDGTININVEGGTEPYTYEWTNTNQTTQNLTGLIKGFYSVTVTDDNNCKVTIDDPIEIEQPQTELGVVYPSNFEEPKGFGLKNGSLEATITGGTAPYTYVLKDKSGNMVKTATVSPIATTTTATIKIEGVGANTYYLTVTDANYTTNATRENCGKLDLEGFELEEPALLKLELEETKSISCNSKNEYNDPFKNGQLTANASGGVKNGQGLPYNYIWKKKDNDGNWQVLLGETEKTLSEIGAGEYAANIVDKNENTLPVHIEYTLKEPELLKVTIKKEHVLCNGGNDGWAEVIIEGGTGKEEDYEIFWSTGETTKKIEGLIAGDYSVIVMDVSKCNAEAEVTIEEPIEPIAINYTDFRKPSTINASDAWIEAIVSGGTVFDDGTYKYSWVNEKGENLNAKTTATPITLNGEKFYQIRLENIPAETYSLTIKDKSFEISESNTGCSFTEDFIIQEPIEASIKIHTPISCHQDNEFMDPFSNGELIVNVTGGVPFSSGFPYNYHWKRLDENGVWIPMPEFTSEIASGLGEGTYAVNVEDSMGTFIGVYEGDILKEAKDVTFFFKQPELLSLRVDSKEATCLGDDGEASVKIEGGVGNYQIEWSTGENTPTIKNLIAGRTYFVSVKDDRGCNATATIKIEQPGGMTTNTEAVNPTCYGAKNGSISVEILEGVGPYSFLWMGTTNETSTIENVGEGDYSLRIIDGTGCIRYVFKTLIQPEPVILDLGEDRTICGGQSLNLDITINDEQATYLWESDNGFTSISPFVELTASGIYKATVITSLGCVGYDEIEVTVSDKAIEAHFVLSTQAFTKEEILLVNISDPIGDKVEWTLPEGAKLISQSKENIILTFDEAGAYDINLRSYQGDCYADFSKTIIVEEATELLGVGESNSYFIEEFKAYSNPSDGNFNVKISLSEQAGISLKVISLLTSQVMSTKQEKPNSEFLLKYNLSHLPSGAYLLLLETPRGNQIRKLIFN